MIILTVLKVILKIILILLLIILLLLAFLLLLRLKYTVFAEYDEGFDAEAQLSVLFGVLKAVYRFGGEDEGLELLIFGRAKKKKDEDIPDTGTTGGETPPEIEACESAEEPEITEDSSFDDIEEEPLEKRETLNDIPEEPPKDTQKRKKRKQKKQSPLEKLRGAYSSFEEFRERYDILLLLKNLKIYAVQQIKSLGVSGGSLDGIIGLGDPSQTGMALGGIGVLRAFAPVEIDISGDFEKKYIALNGSLYGKTYLLKLLLPILRLIFKKPVRTILYDILFKKGSKK